MARLTETNCPQNNVMGWGPIMQTYVILGAINVVLNDSKRWLEVLQFMFCNWPRFLPRGFKYKWCNCSCFGIRTFVYPLRHG